MIRDALAHAALALESTSSSARLDAELLLAHALGIDRARLRVLAEDALAPAAAARFDALCAQRAAGAPVAYLVGKRDFWSLTLAVDPAVLVPRPETELLVELALSHLAGRPAPAVLDLGTGSGAIGLAIASERPDAQVDLVDLSPAALRVAERNRATLGLANARCLAGSWFEPIGDRRYDLIVANPPYLGDGDPHLAAPDLRHEPRLALVSGPDGLEMLSAIAAQAPDHLVPGGRLALEHGAQQGAAVRALLAGAGFAAIATQRDLAGLERATYGARGG